MNTTLAISLLLLSSPSSDTLLTPATITAWRETVPLEQVPAPLSRIHLDAMTEGCMDNPKRLSAVVPGLHIPEYGASLTSSIYLRGFGSRMENPVMGLYIDDIPIMDKNAYDFDFGDIASATLLRGPQGTTYGRNSMCGVLSLRSLSPKDAGGNRLQLEYGTGNFLKLNTSLFFEDHVLSASFRHSDGYFRNACSGKMADPYNGGSIQWRFERRLSGRMQLNNTLSASFSREGGFAYGRYDGESIAPVDYNDEGSYGRFTFREGIKLHYSGEVLNLSCITSFQLLSDDMRMDQDFTPESIFTLRQQQRSSAFTTELILRPSNQREHWHPAGGLFIWGRYNRMFAPVTFKADGIRSIILDNANAHIPSDIGYLQITDPEMPVDSDFDIGTWGAALYHESRFDVGRWTVTAGLRLDYEGAAMAYDCFGEMNYRFVPTMSAPKHYQLSYRGNEGLSALEVLPKLSVSYSAGKGLFLYASLSKGYRAGGFNTQIFTDILQNRMMDGLMKDLGVYLDVPMVSVGAEHTKYAPEEAWNHELGFRYKNERGFAVSASVYHMDGRNQQITVFPSGKSTGRMMANAGKSRSMGTETEISYARGRFQAHLSHGWCNARFMEYNDGNADYSGNRIPYSPEQTLYVSAAYRQPLNNGKALSVEADLRMAGPIYWDEANTIREAAHPEPGARIAFRFTKGEIYVRGDHLTSNQWPVFHFKSLGKEFFSLSKPTTVRIGLSLKL